MSNFIGTILPFTGTSVVIKYVNPYMPTQSLEEDYRPYPVTKLPARFTCGLMSALVICNQRKSVVIHDTECSYWKQVLLNNPRSNQATIMITSHDKTPDTLFVWKKTFANQIDPYNI